MFYFLSKGETGRWSLYERVVTYVDSAGPSPPPLGVRVVLRRPGVRQVKENFISDPAGHFGSDRPCTGFLPDHEQYLRLRFGQEFFSRSDTLILSFVAQENRLVSISRPGEHAHASASYMACHGAGVAAFRIHSDGSLEPLVESFNTGGWKLGDHLHGISLFNSAIFLGYPDQLTQHFCVIEADARGCARGVSSPLLGPGSPLASAAAAAAAPSAPAAAAAESALPSPSS